MPWDLIDRWRDEDATDRRRKTRRLHWRDGRRYNDMKPKVKSEFQTKTTGLAKESQEEPVRRDQGTTKD